MTANILALPLKYSHPVSSHLVEAIKNHIAEHYTDTHPDAFAEDIATFVRFRDECYKLETHRSCLDLALRYHSQLRFFQTKFPTNINIAFSWTLSFSPSMPLWTSFPAAFNDDDGTPPSSSSASNTIVSHPDLNFECANLLFSLAALNSSLGASESRSDKDSIKRCIGYFQTAAGLLCHIRTKICPQIEHLVPPCPDLTPAMLEALEQLMLAQAQECFWQQSVMDGLKNATIAKLSMQVSALYEAALAVTERSGPSMSMKTDEQARCDLPRDWVSHLTVKRLHFRAAAQYRKSRDDMESNRYGDELGRLQAAEVDVKKALDASKRNVSDTIVSDLRSLHGTIVANLSRATKDNDLIYLQPVTTVANLSKIAPALMVKSVLPKEVEDPFTFLRISPSPAYGVPLFQALVPYGVHVAISIYEDRKETLIREELTSRQIDLDAVASSSLQSLGLPGALQAQDQNLPIPPSLLRKGEEIRLDGGVSKLQRLINDVSKIANADVGILEDSVAILDQEAVEDEKVRRSVAGRPWTRPASEEAAQQYRSHITQFQYTLEQAQKSDGIVKEKLADWADTIDVLSSGEAALDAFIPKASSSASSSAQNPVAQSLRAALEELDDLRDSRAAAVAEAKALGRSDDIRSLAMKEAAKLTATSSSGVTSLVVQTSHFESLFHQEIRKYDKYLKEINHSAAAQEKKLEEITQLNNDFNTSRSVDTSTKRREKALQNLDLAHAKYKELSSNLVEGLNFYNSLAKLLNDFRQSLKEWHHARQFDVAQLTVSFAGTSLSSRAGANNRGAQPASASGEGSATRTRSSQRKGQDQKTGAGAQQQASSAQEQQQPQWGKWKGSSIQFDD
ncbi:BRO1-domain-containing protein [Tilletiaria anomala UBC 951]|uniref:BRO1-domain-containing protein n=1 Tax=Tilletiaria anomala (strain ATCC 24038 / CBS 436.72 / UBC 951) TaxID=1037660 RepID=A0A066WR00_TILAU|nr:BRO1-domain-containing protein [Tilletiaria anomala UBC 951]KDN53419.1 BRO1-domain-containing protein [Tilletiaria anomala UBC 951]